MENGAVPKPRKRRQGSRATGTNPRALGTNPRSTGDNLIAKGTSPRQLGTNPRAQMPADWKTREWGVK